jgi:integrase
MPYNKITGDPWKHLHQDITKAKSAYIANDTLQMLRVFYNWLIEPKQHNDPRMRDAENPISDAMSVPKLGPKRLKVEDPKGGKWHKQEPPEDLVSLTDKQTNMLILTIERSLITDPKKRADRMHNRSVLSILFNLVTGARPDVAEHLTWNDVAKAKKNRVVSKGRRTFRLNITYCKEWVFDRIKKLKSNEPGHKFVFASWKMDGTETGISDISKTQKKIFKAAGIPEDINYYRLKHTAANFIYRTTQDIDYTAECLGITKDVLLKRYIRSSNKDELAKKVEVAFNELVAKATQDEKGLKVVG